MTPTKPTMTAARRIYLSVESNPIVQTFVVLGLFALVGRCGG